MKLFYLSSSAFTDNQLVILGHLAEFHDITYGVIIPCKNSNYTEEEIRQYCEKIGVRFLAFKLKKRFRDPRLIFTYYKIIKSIKKSKPDLVYFANFDQLYLNIMLLRLKASSTIIALHDVESHSKTAFAYLAHKSKRILIEKFRHFHTFSEIQQRMLAREIPEKEVYNISLPLIGFGPPKNEKSNSKKTDFLFFGNILHYKGLDILIRAFRNVEKNGQLINLVIAGRCPEWETEYSGLVVDSSNIRCDIRFIENEEIPDYFAQADYLVLPYRDTTQSGPLMIAYNYNVPVLVSSAAGFKEFTRDGVTGYSFGLEKEGDLERILLECTHRSEEEYASLKNSLAHFTEDNFSNRAMVNKYNHMFDKVLSN